ncbi:MAG: dihydrofolate reductase family protein [Clostridia bacterium]|nr:dihydrofolate reductase family protein [Clostridia bacterium]
MLTEQADCRYISYLIDMEIPFIIAGKDEIDVDFALFKLKNIIGCETLLLEGGSIINGSFQRADAIDELSLVVSPIVADKNDKPLFTDSISSNFELIKSENKNGNLILNYKRKK